MKKITTSHGVFGPFVSVVTLDDRYECDGIHYCFSVIGQGSVSEWTEPFPVIAPSDEQTAERAKEVRSHRNSLLAETDWRYRRDMTTTQAWDDYCQALRDVPSQVGFPWEVKWPNKPE